jgi:hypothetical protein
MTACTPLKPFRCWQYRKGEPVPEWVNTNALPKTKFHISLMDGWWYVDMERDACNWYTPAEFAERFRVSAETDACQHAEKIVTTNTGVVSVCERCNGTRFESYAERLKVTEGTQT